MHKGSEMCSHFKFYKEHLYSFKMRGDVLIHSRKRLSDSWEGGSPKKLQYYVTLEPSGFLLISSSRLS